MGDIVLGFLETFGYEFNYKSHLINPKKGEVSPKVSVFWRIEKLFWILIVHFSKRRL